MKNFYFFSILFTLLIFNFKSAEPSIKNNIIAKVGNDIITLFELENKIKTNLLISQSQINEKNINKLKNFALKSLINLKLKNSELQKYSLENNQSAISEHLAKVSVQLNVQPNLLQEVFKRNQINFDQYIKELETEFLWQKLIYQLYIKKISIDYDQISFELNKIVEDNKKSNIPEYHLAEIEIDLNEETNVNEIIQEVEKNIKQIGFEKTAINFSSSTTSLSGGDIGWIKSSSLSKRIINLLENKKIGEITKPFKETNKIIFLKLLDKRFVKSEIKLDLEKIKENLINSKKNELLDLYSNNHLSKIRNLTVIELK